MNTNVVEFDPSVAAVTDAANAAKAVIVTDLKDRAQMEAAKEQRIALKKLRVSIEKFGKAEREQAVAYQKAVIAKEKELIGIIEPEEERLAKYEEEAKALAIREERERKLPERMERLAAADPEAWKDEDPAKCRDYINGLDDVAFEAFYNQQVAVKNQKEADRIATEKAKLDEERMAKERAEREASEAEERKKALAEAEERGRLEAEQRAKAEAERKEREAKEAAERAEAEKKAQEAKLAKQKKFKEFLMEHGVASTPSIVNASDIDGDFIIVSGSTEYVLFKRVSAFTK